MENRKLNTDFRYYYLEMDSDNEAVMLEYTIHKFSSYFGNFIPQCILKSNPSDGHSRWFTDSPIPNQYIMLKLRSPAIVESIKFGKFIKSHVSNLRKFKVLGGSAEDNMSLLLQAGLKNDAEAEVFLLRNKTHDGLYLPLNYIKIVPLQSWGPAYNYSIWFVELKGKNQVDFITQALETINLRKEEEAVRLVLKHLRRRRYKDAFEALSRESGVTLEGPIQSRLWNALVENGDFELAEKIFDEAVESGELNWYLSWQPYTPVWRLITACSSQVEAQLSFPVMRPPPGFSPRPVDLPDYVMDSPIDGPNGESDVTEAPCGPDGCCGKPGPRGGHQLVIDADNGILYLFGGWNGAKDLDDLWSFSTKTKRWSLLCAHSGAVGGPGPRSCHKMVFDPSQRRLYILGRYLDNAQRVPELMKSELFSFDVSSNKWSVLCEDTSSAGGPRLVFDHQMCIDADTQTVYVFGGRILPANTEEAASPQYSGLYAYYIATNTWQNLLPDKHTLPAPQSRVSHSMLFHPVYRRLYILAGQRNKKHLAELWSWDTARMSGSAMCAACCVPPPAGFTQRATLDPASHEIHVLAGMNKETERRVYNTLWVFSLERLSWSCVYRNERVSPDEPRPRFAHQFVYDHINKIHYLFGGNPGYQSNPRVRLDDLWSLQLVKPTGEGVTRRVSAMVRAACYKEMCATDPHSALQYLQTTMSETVDHSEPEEVDMFHRLPTKLFANHAPRVDVPCALSPRSARALATRRAEAKVNDDFTQIMKQVLGGAEEILPEPFHPFEEVPAPEPETWDVGHDEEASNTPEWCARHNRIQLYEELCMFFRPSTVPPTGDVMQLVKL